MNFENVKEKLMFHSGRHPDIDDPRWGNGFLGSLRPFKGKLDESIFHDIMSCLRSLSDYLRNSDLLDKEIVSSINGILHYGRAWALEEEGMLRRNNLISDVDVEKMSDWLNCISDTFCILMDGCDDKKAFETYRFIQEEE